MIARIVAVMARMATLSQRSHHTCHSCHVRRRLGALYGGATMHAASWPLWRVWRRRETRHRGAKIITRHCGAADACIANMARLAAPRCARHDTRRRGPVVARVVATLTRMTPPRCALQRCHDTRCLCGPWPLWRMAAPRYMLLRRRDDAHRRQHGVHRGATTCTTAAPTCLLWRDGGGAMHAIVAPWWRASGRRRRGGVHRGVVRVCKLRRRRDACNCVPTTHAMPAPRWYGSWKLSRVWQHRDTPRWRAP